ncbi:hypothetical protein H4S06_001151 [Coemansia sp. BCRC 34490]|nr:hypothetical protein H4S06_001151 [Coemansia sp. BCRC 34490]
MKAHFGTLGAVSALLLATSTVAAAGGSSRGGMSGNSNNSSNIDRNVAEARSERQEQCGGLRPDSLEYNQCMAHWTDRVLQCFEEDQHPLSPQQRMERMAEEARSSKYQNEITRISRVALSSPPQRKQPENGDSHYSVGESTRPGRGGSSERQSAERQGRISQNGPAFDDRQQQPAALPLMRPQGAFSPAPMQQGLKQQDTQMSPANLKAAGAGASAGKQAPVRPAAPLPVSPAAAVMGFTSEESEIIKAPEREEGIIVGEEIVLPQAIQAPIPNNAPVSAAAAAPLSPQAIAAAAQLSMSPAQTSAASVAAVPATASVASVVSAAATAPAGLKSAAIDAAPVAAVSAKSNVGAALESVALVSQLSLATTATVAAPLATPAISTGVHSAANILSASAAAAAPAVASTGAAPAVAVSAASAVAASEVSAPAVAVASATAAAAPVILATGTAAAPVVLATGTTIANTVAGVQSATALAAVNTSALLQTSAAAANSVSVSAASVETAVAKNTAILAATVNGAVNTAAAPSTVIKQLETIESTEDIEIDGDSDSDATDASPASATAAISAQATATATAAATASVIPALALTGTATVQQQTLATQKLASTPATQSGSLAVIAAVQSGVPHPQLEEAVEADSSGAQSLFVSTTTVMMQAMPIRMTTIGKAVVPFDPVLFGTNGDPPVFPTVETSESAAATADGESPILAASSGTVLESPLAGVMEPNAHDAVTGNAIGIPSFVGAGVSSASSVASAGANSATSVISNIVTEGNKAARQESAATAASSTVSAEEAEESLSSASTAALKKQPPTTLSPLAATAAAHALGVIGGNNKASSMATQTAAAGSTSAATAASSSQSLSPPARAHMMKNKMGEASSASSLFMSTTGSGVSCIMLAVSFAAGMMF